MLFTVLFLLAVELVAVRLWDEFYPIQPAYLDRPPPITKAQKQSAVDLVRTSGIVDRVSGGQAWEVTDVRDHAGIQTVGAYVEWDEPVESNGPWLTNGAPKWLGRKCRNVRSRFHLGISNVRFLRLSVSLESMEIVRLWPNLPPQSIEQYPDDQPVVGQGNFLGRYEIYNEKAGRAVYRGPMILSAFVPGTCPAGSATIRHLPPLPQALLTLIPYKQTKSQKTFRSSPIPATGHRSIAGILPAPDP